MKDTIALIYEIKNDSSHGAIELTRKALDILTSAVDIPSNTKHKFIFNLKNISDKIIIARPNMTSISNITSYFLNRIIEKSRHEKELFCLKIFAQSEIDKIKEKINCSSAKAALNASKLIRTNDNILTCSYSSVICSMIRLLKTKNVKVFVMESKHRNKKYGVILSKELAKHSIKTTIIPDNDLDKHMKGIAKIFVGADSILKDGYLINGIPTYKLAIKANQYNIPFYVVCESLKFNKKFSNKNIKLENGFDLIPPYLITRIITEKRSSGSLKV